MSRPLRLEHEGALWHITSRGNERRNIFRSDADRRKFLELFEKTVRHFRWLVRVGSRLGFFRNGGRWEVARVERMKSEGRLREFRGKRGTGRVAEVCHFGFVTISEGSDTEPSDDSCGRATIHAVERRFML